MAKHDNYDNPCRVKITKLCRGDYEYYTLEYDDDIYKLTCEKDELLAELGEHLDNMKSERR